MCTCTKQSPLTRVEDDPEQRLKRVVKVREVRCVVLEDPENADEANAEREDSDEEGADDGHDVPNDVLH